MRDLMKSNGTIDLLQSNTRAIVKRRRSRWDEDKSENTSATTSKRGFYQNLEQGRYKVSRWGLADDKNFTPQPFSHLPRGVSQNELEILIRKFFCLMSGQKCEQKIGRHRLDDIQRILALGDYENNDPDLRSLSPEPIYDPKTGVRTNTRELRTKEKYTRERNAIIEELVKLDPTFVAPADFRPTKKSKKLYIPDADNLKTMLLG
jgi:splicing factor 1